MRFVPASEINNPEKLISIEEIAMFLNLTEPELVEELLESFTDFTDIDIIGEIVDTLGLDYVCVVESTNKGPCIQGYLKTGGAVA